MSTFIQAITRFRRFLRLSVNFEDNHIMIERSFDAPRGEPTIGDIIEHGVNIVSPDYESLHMNIGHDYGVVFPVIGGKKPKVTHYSDGSVVVKMVDA